jgi:adenylate cyclase
MAPTRQERFAKNVLEAYESPSVIAKSVHEFSSRGVRGASAPHPDFEGLDLGENGSCDLCTAFLDLSSFTWRTFWEPPEDCVRLAVAVLTQVCVIVEELGGHVLGLRGDGVFAGWGDARADPNASVLLCLGACALSLDACQGPLNELLRLDGIQPVNLRAGVDFGRCDFVRIGTGRSSEVDIIGFAPNFAAKCEKFADAWEVVIGEACAARVDSRLLSPHSSSPKRYQHDGQQTSYSFYQLKWKSLAKDAAEAAEQMAGRRASLISFSS